MAASAEEPTGEALVPVAAADLSSGVQEELDDAPARVTRSKPRPIPDPWIDCERCGWRHYPASVSGGWRLVTTCTSCGTRLRDAAGSEVP